MSAPPRGRLAASALAAIAAATTAVSLAGPASAAPTPVPVVSGLVTPLSLSVSHHQIYVTQNFVSSLTRYNHDGSGAAALFARDGQNVEIGGVEAKGPGTLFTLTGKKFSQLVHVSQSGKKTVRANLYAYEHEVNPDASRLYGFRDLTKSCAGRVPKQLGGGDPQKGVKDSHPYGTARAKHGDVYVADAAGNDILRVTPSGDIITVVVLPPQPYEVTAEGAGALGLPKCTVGHTYWFEPVPTDVEVHQGWLYVSTLPGGPESPVLGARGKVYRVNPATGDWKVIGRHLLGATGVAVSKAGKVFATELFSGRVDTFVEGKKVLVAEVESPAAIEWKYGRLFVTNGALPPEPGSAPAGGVVRIVP